MTNVTPKPSILKRILFKWEVIFILILVLINLLGLFLTYQQNQQFKSLQAQASFGKQLKSSTITADWEKIQQIPQLFPNEQEVIELVANLNQARSLFDQFLFSFEADSPLQNKVQPYLPFNLTLTGSPKQILDFGKTLLKIPYVVEMTQISALTTDNFTNQAEVIIKAKLYVSEEFRQ